MFSTRRSLHTTVNLLARTRYTKPKPKPEPRSNVRLPTQRTHHDKNLKITEPIPPIVSNLSCPDDHPLWQFFSDKKYMRKPDELDTLSRPWSIAELRRKSFDDLHSLWYTCLKERNILARENHLLKNDMESRQDIFEQVSENIRTTMWRIRHTLSERDWAFRLANDDFENHKEEFIKEFEKEFLEAPSTEDDESFEMLTRFQRAIFGISEFIDENKVDRTFIDGIKYISTLKLKKFMTRNDEIKSFLEESGNVITDAGESFVLFTTENNETAVKEGCAVVRELREKDAHVSRYEEIETITEYVNQLSSAQVQNPSA